MAKATIDTGQYINNLATTEDFILFPEDNEGAIPLDHGRLEHIRSMSPFVLSINPPNIGNYIQKRTSRPFTGVKSGGSPISYQSTRSTAMYKPNLSSYAIRPINGARPNANNELRQDAGITDRDQIQSIMAQHRLMLDMPPIVFAINPQSMAFNYQSIQSYADPTRYGFIFHRWGEEQVTISINCRIGAFIAGRKNVETPDRDGNLQGISGLQYVSRRDSTGFRNLTSILAMYRNGAAIHDLYGRSKAFHAVGTHSIHYDGQRWEGRIKSMSYSLGEDTQNGGIEFSLEFTVFKHFTDGFEYKPQLFQMHPPRVAPIDGEAEFISDVGGAVADAVGAGATAVATTVNTLANLDDLATGIAGG